MRNRKEILKNKIDAILMCKGDAEAAHSMEDKLHIEVIEEFCPVWVIKEIQRLTKADFSRYCA